MQPLLHWCRRPNRAATSLSLMGLLNTCYCLGPPQQSGALTVWPILGPDQDPHIVGPLTGLKVSRVAGYGHLELVNPAAQGIAIVPLHLGYIQDGAQNHALCRSALLAPGQKLMFHDACCVQASQGGYLKEQQQWFFILPLPIRSAALSLRGQQNYGKLWQAIGQLNQTLDLPQRGHLEPILSRKRAWLTQYQSRFELLPQQQGALFFLRDRLVGLEIAPSAAFFQDIWMPLICFCYGVAAMAVEHKWPVKRTPMPLTAPSLSGIKEHLLARRQEILLQIRAWLTQTPDETFAAQEEERFLNLSLQTLTGSHFTGQTINNGERLIYASIIAKPDYVLTPST